MKTKMLLVIVTVTLFNSVVFSVVSGCWIFQTVPMVLGWHLVSLLRSPLFADHHGYLVDAVGGLLSALLLAGVLTLVALIGRRRGRLTSDTSLNRMLVLSTVIYLILSALPLQTGPCF